ncbi:MAG TPA: MBL fold metallo-hydrolase [Balneolaceae bacterium]|nr:MBL fold metallo-hydrolase [Balneolaceae bacterium]
MKKLFISSIFLCLMASVAFAQRPPSDKIETEQGPLTVQPIRHATLTLSWNGNTIYVDPTGGAAAFDGIKAPNMILITDIHGDHLNVETLNALETEETVLIVPQAVADQLPESYKDQLVVIGNGETTEQLGMSVRAIPMYNLPENSESFHTKGRGNGYVLTMGGKNIYISGDTEDIPEMRSLENIDVAFVCMNLPYTMDIYQAADAVLDFEPAIVYPYHYSGQDTEEFKKLVTEKNENIEVRLRDWYMGN